MTEPYIEALDIAERALKTVRAIFVEDYDLSTTDEDRNAHSIHIRYIDIMLSLIPEAKVNDECFESFKEMFHDYVAMYDLPDIEDDQ